jgi:hypothetical protein
VIYHRRWEEKVAHIREVRKGQKFQWVYLKGKEHFGDLGVDGRIILKWTLHKQLVKWIQLAQNRVDW